MTGEELNLESLGDKEVADAVRSGIELLRKRGWNVVVGYPYDDEEYYDDRICISKTLTETL
jgi:hypothetical protein